MRTYGALAFNGDSWIMGGLEPHVIAVLKGACPFMTDLCQWIDLPVSMDYIAVSSYGAATKSSGEVKLSKDLERSCADGSAFRRGYAVS